MDTTGTIVLSAVLLCLVVTVVVGSAVGVSHYRKPKKTGQSEKKKPKVKAKVTPKPAANGIPAEPQSVADQTATEAVVVDMEVAESPENASAEPPSLPQTEPSAPAESTVVDIESPTAQTANTQTAPTGNNNSCCSSDSSGKSDATEPTQSPSTLRGSVDDVHQHFNLDSTAGQSDDHLRISPSEISNVSQASQDLKTEYYATISTISEVD